MNVLLCHPEQEPRQIIGFCLEGKLGANVHSCANFQDAISYLLEDSPVDVVIVATAGEPDKLFKYLVTANLHIPVILISEIHEKKINVPSELKVLASTSLADAPLKLIPLLQTSMSEVDTSPTRHEYCRIPTNLLVRVAPLKGDVYVRLSSVKYIKLFNSGSVFTRDDMEKYLHKKKVNYFYVKNADTSEFIEKFTQDLGALNHSAKPGDPGLFETIAGTQDLVQELARRIGFTPEVQKIAEANVQLAIKAIGAKPRFAAALNTMDLVNRNYISSHSIAVANFACSIAAQMHWPSEATYEKLVVAALFHDFVFENVNHAKISTLGELDTLKTSLSADEYNLIKTHPILSAEMVTGLSEHAEEIVSAIIVQHHERPDGTGFPSGLHSAQIAPLAAIFIVAHDLFEAIALEKDNFNMVSFLESKETEYQGNMFRRISKALIDMQADDAKVTPKVA